MRTTSRTAAPLGEVIRPMQRGSTGSGFFALLRKQTFGVEAFLQLLEGQLQRAEADRLDAFDINLIFAARFVDADGAAHGDVQAVFRAELHGAQLRFEADAANLRAFIFQRAVDVAGLRFAAIGNFALHQDVGEIFGQRSRMRPVSSVTDQIRRSGMRLNWSCVVMRSSIVCGSFVSGRIVFRFWNALELRLLFRVDGFCRKDSPLACVAVEKCGGLAYEAVVNALMFQRLQVVRPGRSSQFVFSQRANRARVVQRFIFTSIGRRLQIMRVVQTRQRSRAGGRLAPRK